MRQADVVSLYVTSKSSERVCVCWREREKRRENEDGGPHTTLRVRSVVVLVDAEHDVSAQVRFGSPFCRIGLSSCGKYTG